MATDQPSPYVSRAGSKLEHALRTFGMDVRGLRCADFGSHVGGFVDCLLQHGATKVFSVDTSYGTLAWKLRKDPRVVVIERTNAMHVSLPEQVHLITVDVGWTPQTKIIRAVQENLLPDGHVLTLIKPHYEADKSHLRDGVLPEPFVEEVLQQVLMAWQQQGWSRLAETISPMVGHGGNQEFLWLMARSG